MERLPNFYNNVPGGTPQMEYYNANNIGLPLIGRLPTEQMFRSQDERPVYDLNNSMDCDSSRALQMIAPPEPSRRSSVLLDIVQATRKRPSMNSASHCSGLATSTKSCDAFQESRSPEEVNSQSRRPGHGFPRDCLSSSGPSPVGIPRRFRDGEMPVAGLTASKVVGGHGIPHSADKDLESAMAGLEMENVLRGYFHPNTSTRSFSAHNPSSMERRELQAPPLMDGTPSPSSQAECNATSGPPQSGLSDRLATQPASFSISRPAFRETSEGMGTVDFNAITKGKQQIPSAGGKGLSEGSISAFPRAPPGEGFKSRFTRTSTTTIDVSEDSGLKRRRIRGDSIGETQRMTHIAVERNRRKQMNDHLCTLRDLMPSSFVQKTDQASIIGAAVEYVKELEVTLESLQSILRTRMAVPAILNPGWNGFSIPPGPALSAASYTAASCYTPSLVSSTTTSDDAVYMLRSRRPILTSPKLFSIPEDTRVNNEFNKVAFRSAPLPQVEVRFLGEDAILNIALQWKDKQIVQVIVAVESLFLTVLHSTINTVNNTVRYAFFAKVGPKCRMSANEIAATLHQIFNCQLF